jgi:hypothetical protein
VARPKIFVNCKLGDTEQTLEQSLSSFGLGRYFKILNFLKSEIWLIEDGKIRVSDNERILAFGAMISL